MIVRLTNNKGSWTCAETGKGKFVQRLIRAWERMGIVVTQDTDAKVDIDMQISKWNYKPKNARRTVIRRGPCHYDTNMDYKGHNKEDRADLKQCDGIVFQSDFAMKLHESFIGVDKPSCVIFNGADDYTDVKPWVSEYKYNFYAGTREWFWEKRLKGIIDSFIVANIPNSKLWIAGQIWDTPRRFPPYQKEFPKKYKGLPIEFVGQLDDHKIARMYKMCIAFLHACYIDVCPNAVAEALAANRPVLCTNVGGQKELVERTNKSWCLNIDPEYNFKPCDRRNLPKLNKEKYAEGIRMMCDQKWLPEYDVSHVAIESIAKQYLEFFERILTNG